MVDNVYRGYTISCFAVDESMWELTGDHARASASGERGVLGGYWGRESFLILLLYDRRWCVRTRYSRVENIAARVVSMDKIHPHNHSER